LKFDAAQLRDLSNRRHTTMVARTRPFDKLTPAEPCDLADATAFVLRFDRRKRVHDADEIMAELVAKRLVEHLGRAGFVVMRRPAEIGAAALGRGFDG
jgi:hypothetical protein